MTSQILRGSVKTYGISSPTGFLTSSQKQLIEDRKIHRENSEKERRDKLKKKAEFNARMKEYSPKKRQAIKRALKLLK